MVKSVSCYPLTAVDLPAVVQLDQLCFGGLWTLSGYERELASPNSDLLVLTQGNGRPKANDISNPDGCPEVGLIGVGCCWAILDEAHITLLGITPPCQGQGLGQWLLWMLLRAARDRGLQRATLEVRASNTPALHLYEKFGFQIAGRRRHYYSDGEDALILWMRGLSDPNLGSTFQQWSERSHNRLSSNGWQPLGADPVASGQNMGQIQ